MVKRMSIMIVALIIVFGALFGYKAFVNFKISQALAKSEPPPVTVSTEEIQPMAWTPQLKSTGSLRAVQGVQVTSEVGGTVSEITFKSGHKVEQGELLVALNTKQEEATLQGQRAELQLAQQTRSRKQSLRERGLGSEADLDDAQANFRRARAAIAATEAAIDKKKLEAPFAGTIGIRLVDLGQYIAPGTEIATLQALDPLYLDFDLPQASLPTIREDQTVELTLDAYPKRTFEGQISAINPMVDDATRSFRVRASFGNPDGELRPGMFGRITVRLEGERQVLTLPDTAIAYNPYGDFIYVVTEKAPDKDNSGETSAGQASKTSEGGEPALIAKRRNVRTGETRGGQVQIVSGLEAGEQVVIIGHHKLRPGAKVNIDNSRKPEVRGDPQNVENF